MLSLRNEWCSPKGHTFKQGIINETCLPNNLSQTLASQSLTLQVSKLKVCNFLYKKCLWVSAWDIKNKHAFCLTTNKQNSRNNKR